MQNIDFNEIGVFIKVVQSGSFTRASQLLDMPISTVSAKVSSLEKRLGVTLLQRTTRKLNLTQAGLLYYEKCLSGIGEILEAESGVSQSQQEPQGQLKVTAPVYLGGCLLPEVISELTTKYPKIDIELILTDQHIDLISEGVDIAIRAGELKDSSLIAKKIGDTYFVPFASSLYLKQKGTPQTPKDLLNHNCIQFSPLGRTEWSLSNGKLRNKVRMNGRLIVDELNVCESLVKSNQGIALLPQFICKLKSKKSELFQILPDWKSEPRPLFFVYPNQKFLAPKSRAFLDVATEIFLKLL